jgi:hypothetical protein
MALGHERLDVYRFAIGYVAWVYHENPIGPDPDGDSDLDETKPQPGGGPSRVRGDHRWR